MEELKNELRDEEMRAELFSKRTPIIWYRLSDFQLETLKRIAEVMLLHTPIYNSSSSLELYVPGDLLSKTYVFHKPKTW